jgi:hypothetical protein
MQVWCACRLPGDCGIKWLWRLLTRGHVALAHSLAVSRDCCLRCVLAMIVIIFNSANVGLLAERHETRSAAAARSSTARWLLLVLIIDTRERWTLAERHETSSSQLDGPLGLIVLIIFNSANVGVLAERDETRRDSSRGSWVRVNSANVGVLAERDETRRDSSRGSWVLLSIIQPRTLEFGQRAAEGAARRRSRGAEEGEEAKHRAEGEAEGEAEEKEEESVRQGLESRRERARAGRRARCCGRSAGAARAARRRRRRRRGWSGTAARRWRGARAAWRC